MSLAAALALCAAAAWAQGGAVPPPRSQSAQDAERGRKAVQDGIVDAATRLPGQIVTGAGMLQRATGGADGYRLLQYGDRVGNNFGRIVDGTKLLDSYVRDGQQGLFDAGTQMLMDHGGQSAAEALLKPLVRRAVVGGTAGVLATGGASIAFEGGVILGGVLRNNWSIGGKLLGDHVDDFYFGIAPDSLKEWASGTKQADWDSAQFAQQAADDAARRRRQATFARVQDEMAQQQEQLQRAAEAKAADAAAGAAAAAHAATRNSTPVRAAPDPAQAWMDALNQATALQRVPAQRSTPVAGKPACQLDQRTGCHPGHDEKSHPGGCKVC